MRARDDIEARITSGLIGVGTTSLYHEVRGSGPALLFITGATGDAGEWAQVASALAQELTVVTYDRRGFSRSPRPVGWAATSMTEQAADAAGLLRALDLAPAVVVGHSSGASIACHLVARHPEVVRHAVLYEPPLLGVVAGGKEIAAGLLARARQGMAEAGPRRAMEVFMRANVGDELVDGLFASIDPVERDRVLDNGAVLVAIEIPAVAAFVPDRAGMRASGVPLTVVMGEENRETWLGAGSAWLAEGTGAELVELPGGHVGFVTHPDRFVELVRRIAAPAAPAAPAASGDHS
jgi:pimeloyl-ACP methyl ester carboxylesterase